MPVKRRRAKARSGNPDAWDLYLETGCDYFDDLAEAGVAVDERGNPSRADALSAWLSFADELLARWAVSRHPDQGQPWAVAQFGDPRATTRRRCR